MPYYSGTVKAKDLFTTILNHITAIQPGESQAWWRNESSLASDMAFTSTGSSGTDRIVITLREGTQGRNLTIGTARDYTPGPINAAGTYDNLVTQDVYYFSSTQSVDAMVSYDLNVTKDRIILHVQGDKLIGVWSNAVAYIGMIARYDPNDRTAIGFAVSENDGTANRFKMVENSIGTAQQDYGWYYVASPDNPSWGNTYFLEILHVGNAGEGLRGELDGLYGMHQNGTVDGDEIDVSGTRYKVIQRRSNGHNGFPRTCLVMKKS